MMACLTKEARMKAATDYKPKTTLQPYVVALSFSRLFSFLPVYILCCILEEPSLDSSMVQLLPSCGNCVHLYHGVFCIRFIFSRPFSL